MNSAERSANQAAQAEELNLSQNPVVPSDAGPALSFVRNLLTEPACSITATPFGLRTCG